MNDEDTPDVRFNRRFIAYFAVGLCLAAMAYIGAITFIPFPKDNAQFANTVLGFIMGTVMASPIGFFFGSSKSSQAKDEMIASAIPPLPPAGYQTLADGNTGSPRDPPPRYP